jgi:glycosyltransferase involved in cell wall biosynthesis
VPREVSTEGEIPRVLVLLGNAALHGQERGNIEVFYAAKDVGVDALFVTHAEWGHAQIEPALERLGLRWTTLAYAYHFTKRLGPLGWVRNIGRLLAASWGLWNIIRKYRPTHIHAANQHYLFSVLPALWLTRVPLVYRLGDVPAQHHVLYRIVWKRLIVPRVQRFVCISEYVQRSLLAMGVAASKTQVLYSHPPERPDSRILFVSDPFDGVTVTYVGQIRPHKGVHLLIEAALSLCHVRDDVRFLLAGSVARNNPFALALIAKVQAAGMGDRIRFLGYVDDVPGLLAASDLHVCPSVCEEALGNVVLEAKVAGVPSLIFPSGGLPELIEEGRDGWICHTATERAIREQVAIFLDLNPKERTGVGAQAKASLERMGITKRSFAESWKRVFESTR